MKLLPPVMLVVILAIAGCGGESPQSAADDRPAPLRIAVSIAPLTSLIDPMLPAESHLQVILGARATPHAEELTPSQIQAAAEADLLVYLGGGADPAIERIARARRRSGLPSVALHDEGDDSGAAHDHGHAHADGHAWLHPHQVEEAIPRIRSAIECILAGRGGLSPAAAARIARGEAAALQSVRETHHAYQAVLSSMHGARFISLHGAFDAVLSEYGLTPVVTVQPGHSVEPGAGAIDRAARAAAASDLFIIVEATMPDVIADRLSAETGVAVARLDPIHSNDWERMMRANLQSIIAAHAARRP